MSQPRSQRSSTAARSSMLSQQSIINTSSQSQPAASSVAATQVAAEPVVADAPPRPLTKKARRKEQGRKLAEISRQMRANGTMKNTKKVQTKSAKGNF
jgi:hypothetical protein